MTTWNFDEGHETKEEMAADIAEHKDFQIISLLKITQKFM
jgi:hypothetical protein